MEENKEYNKKVKELKRWIRTLLEKNELYSPELTYQVEVAASILVVFRDVAKKTYGKDVTITEKSREGHPREIKNPAYDTYCMMAKAAQNSLKSLMMNREIRPEKKIESGEDNDILTNLMNDLKDE